VSGASRIKAQEKPSHKSIDILQQRRCGVLAPITSLPAVGSNRQGGFDSAQRFIDWIACAGISVWQLLPMGRPHADLSPYLCLSSMAGNSDLIGLDWLLESGFLQPRALSELSDRVKSDKVRSTAINCACKQFSQLPESDHRRLEFKRFCRQSRAWLDNFALFMALREEQQNQPWHCWPPPLRDRDRSTIADAQQRLGAEIFALKFTQFLFFRQWQTIRHYARDKGVFLFGDMPLFVAWDSADVWANRDYFKLAEDGQPLVVAGVPPDYFSATGQRWGNPHYNWAALQRDNFQWWIERLRVHLSLYDLLRLDHFRGLESAWEIPTNSTTAMHGTWQKAVGTELLSALQQAFQPSFKKLPLVAEDLGLITADVRALRDQFDLPGMAVLQFAFDGDSDNPSLPHNHTAQSVVYTGTHDNDTSLSWFQSLPESQRQKITTYLQCTDSALPGALVECALASVATLAVVPLQDMLELGSGHRINTPGTVGDNWRWQFQWQQLTETIAERFATLNRAYHRCPQNGQKPCKLTPIKP
jgi:4-alpha-glucanotransferase